MSENARVINFNKPWGFKIVIKHGVINFVLLGRDVFIFEMWPNLNLYLILNIKVPYLTLIKNARNVDIFLVKL